MSELNFQEMLEESIKTIHNGEIVEGTVMDVKSDEIILNIGYKADGYVSYQEYTSKPDVDLQEAVHVGDKMEVKVLRVNDGDGQVALSYKALNAGRINEKLEAAFQEGTVLKGKVSQVLSGGLSVLFEDSRVFIPASLVSDVYEKDLSGYQDQEIEFYLIEFNPKRRRVIGDRKKLLLEEKAKRAEELMAKLQVGDIINGIVKNVTDFGAFVDLGGVDGLLHISEMFWGKPENPKKAYKAGDEVRVFVKDIKENRIALSVLFEDENPWNDADVKYAKGNIVKGVVARMTDFGAFVELEQGIDALMHVSQISLAHVNKPSDVLKIGQEVEAKVIDFNGEAKRISLSLKAMELDAKKAAEEAGESGEVPVEAEAPAETDAPVETEVPAEAEAPAETAEAVEAAETASEETEA